MLSALAASAGAAGGGDGIGREKFVHGELDAAEHVTGVLLAVVISAAAVLGGDAVVVDGDEQLGIPLQADDRELAQGDKDPMLVAAGHQLVAEAGGHRRGDIQAAAVAGAALAHIHQLQTEDQGVHRLHHRGGQVGLGYALHLALAPVGGKALGAALAAEEHDPLTEHGQAADLDGAGRPHKGIGCDAVEVPHIHGKEAPVEGDRLHINVRVQQLGGPGLDGLGPVDYLLRTAGGVNSQILDAVLVSARVKDLFRVYAHGLPDTAIVTDGAGHDLFWHRIPS